MDGEAFKIWLTQSVALGERSAKDVASRVRRASEMVAVGSKTPTDDLLHKLSKHEEFKALTPTVKSQLRRSIKLYREWKATL